MYCVVWTYKMPAGHSAQQIKELFAKTADIYIGVPGLIRNTSAIPMIARLSSASIFGS